MNRSGGLMALVVLSLACSDEVEDPSRSVAISGQVVDEAGAPLAGAEVTSVPTTQTVSTDAEGRFTLLAQGLTRNYRILVELDNYAPAFVDVSPEQAQGPDPIIIRLSLQVICAPGERRCSPGDDNRVEVCNALGTSYQPEDSCAEQTCVNGICRETFTLTVAQPSLGAIVGPRINCGSTCEASYPEGTQVELEAVPLPRGGFLRWGGACADAPATTCSVTMTADLEVSAEFEAIAFELVVRRVGNGRGRVTSEPAGIDCGADCRADFDRDATVTLTAVADDGAEFQQWERACGGNTPTCTLTMDEAKNVRARFGAPTFTLRVEKEGAGDGTVTADPGDIDCEEGCTEATATLSLGTEVTLSAEPDAQSTFDGWTGCAQTDPCTVTLDRDVTVRARFTPIPFYLLPLAADADCLAGLSFDGGMPLVDRCGGPDAVLRGVARRDDSRVVALDQAYFTDDSTAFTGLDTGRVLTTTATLELTVRRDGPAIDGTGRAILIGDVDAAAPAGGLRLVAEDNGAVAIQTWRNGRPTATATAANVLAPGQWAHVAATVDGGMLTVFVDGQRRASAPATGWTASSSTAWVGAQQDGAVGATHRLNGAFDEVRLSGSVRY